MLNQESMTTCDIITAAAQCLTLDNIVNKIINDDIFNTQEQREVSLLFDCTISVIDEIGREYVPLVYRHTVKIDETLIVPFSEFPFPVMEILEITRNGIKVSFNRHFDKVEFKQAGEYSVLFAYSPQILITVCDNLRTKIKLEWHNTRIGVRLIAFGVVAEYCMRLGMTDEAIMWDRRYKDALLAAMRVRREQRVKERRFK